LIAITFAKTLSPKFREKGDEVKTENGIAHVRFVTIAVEEPPSQFIKS